MKARRRAAVALVLSVALHLLVLAWLTGSGRVRIELPARAENEVIEFEVAQAAPPADEGPAPSEPAAQPAPEAQRAPQPRPAPSPQPSVTPQPPRVAVSPPQAEGTPGSREKPAGSPESQQAEGRLPAAGAPSPDWAQEVPYAQGRAEGGGVATSDNGLFPVIPGVGGARANPYASMSKGRTIRNGEGEAPDPEALAQMNAERARRTVQGFAIDDLAEARVRGGVVDGYFVDVRKTLQRHAESPPKWTEGATFVHDLLAAWSPGASQYGKTGNPYGEGKAPLGSGERDATNPIFHAARERPGGVEAEVYAKQQAADRLREFADGRFGEGIVALVEIRQRRDGQFETAALVRSSGNRQFDRFVLATAPQAMAEAPPAPGYLDSTSPEDGLRTLWSFEGRISYRHKVKPGQMKTDELLGLAAMSALSALSGGWVPGGMGSFDEVTGEVEVIDLTRPKFVCNVKLLRVY